MLNVAAPFYVWPGFEHAQQCGGIGIRIHDLMRPGKYGNVIAEASEVLGNLVCGDFNTAAETPEPRRDEEDACWA
jgi:hypothetical protein